MYYAFKFQYRDKEMMYNIEPGSAGNFKIMLNFLAFSASIMSDFKISPTSTIG